MGSLAFLLLSSRRRIAQHNIAKAFPEKTDEEISILTRLHFQHLGNVILDLITLPSMNNPEILRKKIELEGSEIVEKELGTRGGAIFMSAHMGSWESLCTAPLFDYPLYGLFRKQSSRFDSILTTLRTSCGVQLFPNDRNGMKALLKEAKAGGFIAVLADQGRGPELPFFGEPARFPKGGVAFNVRHGLKAFPIFALRSLDGRIKLRILPAIEAPSDLHRQEAERCLQRKFISVLEKQIVDFPEQYYWVHDIWRNFK